MELVLQLELDAGGEEGCPLQQAADQRVLRAARQPPEALRDTGKLGRELLGVIVEVAQLFIVEGQEFAIYD